MKIDLKILLVILAVVLLVGFLEAEPSSRRRTGSSTSRRRSYSSSGRRRSSSYSRRRRTSYNSSSSSSESSTSTIVIVVVVIVVLVVIGMICYFYLVFWRRRQSLPHFEPEVRHFENRNPIYNRQDDDAASKTEGEPANENHPPQSTAFDNAGVDTAPILPYPPGNIDQNPVYPQASLPYPPQEGIYPPDEVKNAPPYPSQSTSSAYPPQGTGEEVPGVHQATWPGQAHEGSTVCAPPIQFESGHDLPPPPAYDDIESKKKL